MNNEFKYLGWVCVGIEILTVIFSGPMVMTVGFMLAGIILFCTYAIIKKIENK